MNSPKVNLWGAMSNKQIIGPYFFEDENSQSRKLSSKVKKLLLSSYAKKKTY